MRLTDKKNLEDKKRQAYEFFVSKGLTPMQASAMVGNAVVESNLNTKAKGDLNLGSPSVGIFQHRGERLERLKKMYQDPYKFENQLEFAWWELNNTHKHALRELQNAEDVKQATLTVRKKYEVAWSKHDDRRIQESETVFNTYNLPKEKTETEVSNYTPPVDKKLEEFVIPKDNTNVGIVNKYINNNIPLPNYISNIEEKKLEERFIQDILSNKIQPQKTTEIPQQVPQDPVVYGENILNKAKELGIFQQGGEIEPSKKYLENWFDNPKTRDILAANLQDPLKADYLISTGLENLKQVEQKITPSQGSSVKGSFSDGVIEYYGEPTKETSIHEQTHALENIDKELTSYILKNYGSPLKNLREKYNVPLQEAIKQQFKIDDSTIFGKDKIKKQIEFGEYMRSNGELYPRFMEMRSYLNVTPTDTITDEHIQKLQQNENTNILFNYYSAEQIKEILNTVAQNDRLKDVYYAQEGGEIKNTSSYTVTGNNFKEAFKKARQKLGPNQVFIWNNNKYGTNLKGEEFNPSPEVIKAQNLNTERINLQNKLVKNPYVNKNTVKITPEYKDWDEIKKRKKEINKMSQAEKIITYNKLKDNLQQKIYTVKKGDTLSQIAKNNNVSLNDITYYNNIDNPNKILPGQKLKIIKNSKQYLIVDKKNARMHLYRGGEKVDSFEVGVGKKEGDAQTVTKTVNGKIDWGSGNYSTGAGKYTISQVNPSNKTYYNLPSFNLKNEQGIEVSTAIHGTPYARRKYFNDGNNENNRMSYGCINGKCQDLSKLYEVYNLKEGDEVYILPEDEKNEFVFENGVLNFKSNSNKDYNKYVDQKGNVQKGQGINRTINTLNYNPIKLEIDKPNFTKDKFTWNDFNDEKEYNNTVVPFVKAMQDNKKRIMKEMKIDGDTYNELTKIAFGIFGNETNFGDTHSAAGNFIRAITKYINPKTSSPDYKSKYNTYKANEDDNSIGLTQLRWKYIVGEPELKKRLQNLNIKSSKDLLDPEKAAIATVARLAFLINNRKGIDRNNLIETLPQFWGGSSKDNKKTYTENVKKNANYLKIKELY